MADRGYEETHLIQVGLRDFALGRCPFPCHLYMLGGWLSGQRLEHLLNRNKSHGTGYCSQELEEFRILEEDVDALLSMDLADIRVRKLVVHHLGRREPLAFVCFIQVAKCR